MKRIAAFASILAALALVVSVGFTYAQPGGGATPQALEGKPAPDFNLETLEGEQVKLSDQKGKVVVVDFWATWCPPCVKGLPHLQELADDESMAEKGLVVWAVNAREGKDKIEPFMKKHNLSMSVPMDKDGATMTKYNVRGIPTTVIIGRDGNVRKAFVGFGDNTAKQIHDAVEEALNEGQEAA